MDINSERSQLPLPEAEQATNYQEQMRAPHEPSMQTLALIGLAIVTLILGGLAFWFAAGVRRMEATATQQGAVLATLEAQVAAEAAARAEAQAAAQATVQALEQAAEAKLAEEQAKSAAYSRIVRANQLANNALLELERRPQAALLLAIESLRIQRENGEAPLPESVQRLRSILGATGGVPLETQEVTSALAVSGDKRFVAAGDEAGAVHVWDLRAPAAPPQRGVGHAGPIFHVAFGPQGVVYSAGEDGTLRRWTIDVDSGATTTLEGAIVVPAPAGSPALYTVAVAPDGRQLATAGDDGVVYVVELGTPNAAPVELRGHTGAVNTLAYSPDGRLLATGGNDGTVRFWNTADGELQVVLSAPDGVMQANFIHIVHFSPDGRWIASGSNSGEVRLWRVLERNAPEAEQIDPQQASIPLRGHESAVYVLSFSPDSNFLASADEGGAVRLWSMAQPEDNTLLGRHSANVRGLAFARGELGPVLVSAGYDGQVRLWNYRSPDDSPVVVRGHDDVINQLAAPAGAGGASNLLVTAGYDRSLRIWHTDSPFAEPQQVLSALPDVTDVADVVTDAASALLAAYAEASPIVRAWDTASGAIRFELAYGDAPISAIAFSPARSVLWAGSTDGTIAAWDTVDGILLRTTAASGSAISAVAESPDGTMLATGDEDGVIRLWDATSTSLLRELTGHTGPIRGVAFSADGKTLVSGGSGTGALRLWDVQTGAERQVLEGPPDGLLDVAVQPNGPWVVGAGSDGAVWVWNADALTFEPARLTRHTTEVNAVNFSADGQVLASAGADGAVYLWSTSNPSAEPDSLAGRGDSVNGIGFAPTGAWVASGSADGTIRRWSLNLDALIAEACRTAGRNFTLEEWTQYFPTDVSNYRKTCPGLPGP
jgi:WD40 repeat protein